MSAVHSLVTPMTETLIAVMFGALTFFFVFAIGTPWINKAER